jgi:hypothetical protein
MNNKNDKKTIELTDDIELMFACAVRYALGRRTYMPDVVQRTLTPLLPSFSKKTLRFILNDLKTEEDTPGFFGDEQIDRPGWIKFRGTVQEEYDKRE